MTALKTLISYYGGKQRIASEIVREIRKIPHTAYAEPFGGGLSVLYAKGKPPIANNNDYREVINDKNKQLITFWRCAREKPEELARILSLTPYSQEEHKRAREIYNNPSEYSDLDVAWAVYIECNMSFAHQVGKGWTVSVKSENHAVTWANRSTRLPECFDRLSDVYIGCEDSLDFIDRWDSPQTLFYLDPPYLGADQGHYGGYSIEDCAALCRTLDNAQGSYILSNYSQDVYPSSAEKVVEIEAVMSASGGKHRADKKRIEKLWILDRSDGMRADIKSIALSHQNKHVQLELLDRHLV